MIEQIIEKIEDQVERNKWKPSAESLQLTKEEWEYLTFNDMLETFTIVYDGRQNTKMYYTRKPLPTHRVIKE